MVSEPSAGAGVQQVVLTSEARKFPADTSQERASQGQGTGRAKRPEPPPRYHPPAARSLGRAKLCITEKLALTWDGLGSGEGAESVFPGVEVKDM